jgi:hypothetical protein
MTNDDLEINLLSFKSVELDDEDRIQVRSEAIKLVQHLSSCVVADSAERRLLKYLKTNSFQINFDFVN